jgi:GntR family transcriptional regulator
MAITVDAGSGTSLEEQLCSQLREHIVTGKLAEGASLPSIRQLATDLAIHFNTVARAYRRLEIEGLLVIAHGRGVFVKRATARPAKPSRETKQELAQRLRQILVDARLTGLTAAQTEAFVLKEVAAFFEKEMK